MAINDKTYINLYKDWRAYYGSDKTKKFNCCMFEANAERKDEGIEFWVLFYDSAEKLADKKQNKDPDPYKVISIKSKDGKFWNFLSWVYIDDDKKEVFWANLYENNQKKSETDYDQLIIMKEAEFRWNKEDDEDEAFDLVAPVKAETTVDDEVPF